MMTWGTWQRKRGESSRQEMHQTNYLHYLKEKMENVDNVFT